MSCFLPPSLYCIGVAVRRYEKLYHEPTPLPTPVVSPAPTPPPSVGEKFMRDLILGRDPKQEFTAEMLDEHLRASSCAPANSARC